MPARPFARWRSACRTSNPSDEGRVRRRPGGRAAPAVRLRRGGGAGPAGAGRYLACYRRRRLAVVGGAPKAMGGIFAAPFDIRRHSARACRRKFFVATPVVDCPSTGRFRASRHGMTRPLVLPRLCTAGHSCRIHSTLFTQGGKGSRPFFVRRLRRLLRSADLPIHSPNGRPLPVRPAFGYRRPRQVRTSKRGRWPAPVPGVG